MLLWLNPLSYPMASSVGSSVLCRCETGTASLERPSTRERMRGRVPLTVLEPSAQLLAAADRVTPAGGNNQEQQQAEPSTSRSGSDTWQQQATQDFAADQQQQQQLDTSMDTLAAAAPRIPLKVITALLACCNAQLCDASEVLLWEPSLCYCPH